DAGLGRQPAIGVLALDAYGRRLDASNVAAAGLHDLGLPAAILRPAQVHAQQDLGPVLGLGAAGAGLDVEEGVGRVHLAGEHALELQLLHLTRKAVDVGLDRLHGFGVVLGLGQVEQFGGADQAIGQVADAVDGLVEQGALAPQRLRALGVVPDVRVLELALYFLEALALRVVVKETPSAHPAG